MRSADGGAWLLNRQMMERLKPSLNAGNLAFKGR
jgi:hypothetical protein